MTQLIEPRHIAELFSDLRRETHAWLDARLHGARAGPAAWRPTDRVFAPVELRETDGEFVVRMDVPGVEGRALKVTHENGVITVEGERRRPAGPGQVRYSECSYGAFVRSVAMPSAIRPEGVRACCTDGVLEVHAPKAVPGRAVRVEEA